MFSICAPPYMVRSLLFHSGAARCRRASPLLGIFGASFVSRCFELFGRYRGELGIWLCVYLRGGEGLGSGYSLFALFYFRFLFGGSVILIQFKL